MILKLEQHLAMFLFILPVAQCKSRRIFVLLGPSSILFNVFSIKNGCEVFIPQIPHHAGKQ